METKRPMVYDWRGNLTRIIENGQTMHQCVWHAEPSGDGGGPGREGGEVCVQWAGTPGRQAGRQYKKRAARSTEYEKPDSCGDWKYQSDPLYH